MFRVAQRALFAVSALALVSAFVLLGGERQALAGVPHTPTRFDDPVPDGCLPGDCSLREALISASNNPGPDSITLPAGTYTLSIPGQGEGNGTTGDLNINDDLLLRGNGSGDTIIDAASIDRVLTTSGDVTIEGVTLRNGAAGSGGGISAGSGELTLKNVAVTHNVTTDGVFGNGGGIFGSSASAVVLDNATIANNHAGSGGGITSVGSLTIIGGSIADNLADDNGGGLNFGGASLLIERATFTGNTAAGDGYGGGLFLSGPAGTTYTIRNSTITDNTAAGGFSGGLHNQGDNFLNLTNVTISGNTASGSAAMTTSGHATSVLTNVTIAANSSGDSGYALANYATTTLENTIIDDETRSCVAGEPITSSGHNIDSDGTCQLTGTGDMPSTDPMLGPLADNGGPTETLALLAGSPAINGGDDAACPFADQRGFGRVDVCDIGAFEFGGTAVTVKQGDVNCDDEVTAVDALFVLRFVAGIPPVAECLNLAGDVNCDGAKTAVDALGVLRFVAGLPVNQNEPCADIGTPV